MSEDMRDPMTEEEYMAEVRRTWVTPTVEHMVEGIATETGELLGVLKKRHYGKEIDWLQLLLEAGDCFWYITGLKMLLDERLPSRMREVKVVPKSRDLGHLGRILFSKAGDIVSVVENLLEAPLDNNGREWVSLNWYFCQYEANFFVLLDFLAIEINEVRETNVRKLRLRHPRGFSADNAKNEEAESAAIRG